MVVLVVHGLPGSSKTSLSRALVFRDRFREFLHVSKDFCKSTLLLLRDADDASCDGGDAWRDRGSLLKRLARCRETLAESSSVLVEDLDLESCFAERLVELATSCSLPSRPDDDTLNAWSYQVMLAVTESVLGSGKVTLSWTPRSIGWTWCRTSVRFFRGLVRTCTCWRVMWATRRSGTIAFDGGSRPGVRWWTNPGASGRSWPSTWIKEIGRKNATRRRRLWRGGTSRGRSNSTWGR